MTSKKYRENRKQLGTQQKVAELLGVTRQLISARETGGAITREAELALLHLLATSQK